MREILFKGKRIDNREWVYGYLGEKYTRAGDEWELLGFAIQPPQSQNTAYLVDPNTIGQYTGIKDKNGKKIFEGDIVRAHYDGEYERIYQVMFYNGGYKLKSKDCYTVYDYSIHDEHPDFEVIGNIYDNPELKENEIQS